MARPCTWAAAAVAAALVSAVAPRAPAFCGFYVSGADQKLYNKATQVVLMREGLRTVLSMQNNYQGPPEAFAMVVPAPVVLQKENVKTLPREVFDRIDKLAAPRLVEYWEQDPCQPPMREERGFAMAPKARMAAGAAGPADDLGVKIEAQFTVGEYEVVILSASDSMGLDTWLRREKYSIPAGAEPLLRPYVEQGMKFFVAKVDPSKVRFENGMATLSPLRFHYDTERFTLPIRLGLVNSPGTQDLIVHILARGQRYEVANYPNVTIPTNLDVDEKARDQFPAFYAALFDRTLEKNPRSVVTEYAWDAGTCDPCPIPALTAPELATLGDDVLVPAASANAADAGFARAAPGMGRPPPSPIPPPRMRGIGPWATAGRYVLTRLHARYGKESLGEDLVLKPAEPIAGGREHRANGELERASTTSTVNNFQGRYAIRHPWKGEIACANPVRGVWGGPPAGVQADTRPKPATNLAFAPRGGVDLASFVKSSAPEIDLLAPPAPAASAAPAPSTAPASRGCFGCSVTGGTDGAAAAAIAGAAVMALVRRRRRTSP
jgi:hypothetical protein